MPIATGVPTSPFAVIVEKRAFLQRTQETHCADFSATDGERTGTCAVVPNADHGVTAPTASK